MQGTYVCPFKMNLQSSGFLLKHILDVILGIFWKDTKKSSLNSVIFSCAVLGSKILGHDKISYGHSLCDLPGLTVSV